MPNFKKYSYAQTAMVVIDFQEQLRPGTFEFTLHHLIDVALISLRFTANIKMNSLGARLTILQYS
jgi:hypothetical protein